MSITMYLQKMGHDWIESKVEACVLVQLHQFVLLLLGAQHCLVGRTQAAQCGRVSQRQ